MPVTLAAAVALIALQSPVASPPASSGSLSTSPSSAPSLRAASAAAAQAADNAPWPVRLGVRVAQLEVSLPVARQVTIVPDLGTWLDEMSRWTRESRWPVLIEDDRLTPLFIAAFKPERVIRRTSVGPLPQAKAEREKLMDAVVARAWNGDPTAPSLAALQKANLVPPGVAITRSDDEAWPAAVALAAGRGLPLLFVDGEFGSPNDTLTTAQCNELEDAIRSAIATTSLPYQSLGDAIDAVVLCRNVGAKCRPDLSPDQTPAQRIQWPASGKVAPSDPNSTLDTICRNKDGSRYAVAGWIFGPSPRAAYMAMCSLFLERESWWFLSGYASGEPWSIYAPDDAAAILKAGGFTTRVTVGQQMSLANWRRSLMGGFDADVLVMNSSGDSSWFSLAGNDRGDVLDVPFLARPAALHLIHSWSLSRPADRYTVGDGSSSVASTPTTARCRNPSSPRSFPRDSSPPAGADSVRS